MSGCSTARLCKLLVIGAGVPCWCYGTGEDERRSLSGRNVRRRTRYITKLSERSGALKNLFSTEDDGRVDMVFRGISFSMPDTPEPTLTPTVPVEPTALEDRDSLIEAKCGVTEIERSRDILTELLTVSTATSLINPETSQYKARDWLDKIDPAIICPENAERIHQRYRVALLYYELGGSSWTRCRAERDVISSDTEEECPGKRFLDRGNECEWGGINCGDAYNDVTAEWLDAYYPVEVLNLQSNNLMGELFDEFFDFRNLKEIFLNNNNLSGTIEDEIGNFERVTILQLQFNSFEGPVPEAGLYQMEQLAGLSIHGNNMQGSIQELCDARDDRRVQFESYLALVAEADCLGDPPEVICSCCKCF